MKRRAPTLCLDEIVLSFSGFLLGALGQKLSFREMKNAYFFLPERALINLLKLEKNAEREKKERAHVFIRQ